MPIPLNQVTTAEIVLRGTIASGGSGAVTTNFVFHYRRTAVAVNPTKTALNTAFQAGPVVPLAAALNVGWSASINDVRWVNDAQDQYVSFANPAVGAIAGDRLSTVASVYLLFRTGLRGRAFRGSKHLGPFSESDVTAANEDLLNAAAQGRVGAINAALATPLVDATGNTWNFTLLSRSLSQLTLNPTTVTVNDITQFLFNKRVGTMRRRQAPSSY